MFCSFSLHISWGVGALVYFNVNCASPFNCAALIPGHERLCLRRYLSILFGVEMWLGIKWWLQQQVYFFIYLDCTSNPYILDSFLMEKYQTIIKSSNIWHSSHLSGYVHHWPWQTCNDYSQLLWNMYVFHLNWMNLITFHWNFVQVWDHNQ